MADRRASTAVLVGGFGVALLHFALPAGWPQAVVFLLLLCLPITLLVARLGRESLLGTRPWTFLLAGLGLYTAGAVVARLVPLLSGRPLPFPSPLDVVFFASYLLYAAFLLGVLRRRYTDRSDHRRARILALVDAGIFTAAAAGVLWPLLFTPILDLPDVSGPALLTAAAYPILTALLFGLVVKLLVAGRRPGGEEVLLAVWVGGELLGVVSYGVVSAAGMFHFGHPMVLTWFLSWAALAAAAAHPSLTVLRPDRSWALATRRWWSWLLLPVVLSPMGVGLVIAGLDGELEPSTRMLLMGLTVVGIALAFARLHLVSGDLAEQRRLATELVGLARRLEHQALHDPLTGLGNRRMLMERLDHATRQRPRHPEARTALLLLDLDGFKAINDTLGHDCGDEVLIEVAGRLSAALRPGDTLIRLGGDEFAVVLEQVDARQAAGAAARVIEALRAPMTVGGEVVSVWASLGIELAGQDADPGARLKNADLAMYAAKAAGGDRYEFFDIAMRDMVLARVRLERELRLAAEEGQLRLVYQPVVDLRTGAAVGVEALLRWAHPRRGLLRPDAFIETAEESGAIVGIGRWVVEEACRQAARWAAEGDLPEGFHVAVNVSRRQLLEPGIVDLVAAAIEEAGIPPTRICLEVTETALFANVYELIATLRDLKDIGVTIAMDDFGTGYSSLEQLRHLPIDVLKIDRSFVGRIDQRAEDYALATAIVRLATSLGKTTLAEGVETPGQLAHIRALKADLAQGYLFARPLEAAAAIAMIRMPAQRR